MDEKAPLGAAWRSLYLALREEIDLLVITGRVCSLNSVCLYASLKTCDNELHVLIEAIEDGKTFPQGDVL